MSTPDIYNNIDSNTSYTIYDDNGQYGAVASDQTPPVGSTTIATDVSGKTMQTDARKERKGRMQAGQQTSQNAQQQEEQMTAQYYSYLTNGASSSGNLCSA